MIRNPPNLSQAASSSSIITIGGNCNNDEVSKATYSNQDHDVDCDDRESNWSHDEEVVQVVADTPVDKKGAGSSVITLRKETVSKRLNTGLERRRQAGQRVRLMVSKYIANASYTSGLPASKQKDQLITDSELVYYESCKSLLDVVVSFANMCDCNLTRKLFKDDE